MIYNINWNDTIKKEFGALNNEDLGEVHEIANGHILVQRGVTDKEKFPFPRTKQKVIMVSFS
jgi:hypothetical protein